MSPNPIVKIHVDACPFVSFKYIHICFFRANGSSHLRLIENMFLLDCIKNFVLQHFHLDSNVSEFSAHFTSLVFVRNSNH